MVSPAQPRKQHDLLMSIAAPFRVIVQPGPKPLDMLHAGLLEARQILIG